MSRGIDYALIGGTGLYALSALGNPVLHAPATPYGPPSASIHVGDLGELRIAFLARHGEGHSLPPHRINYRANLWALKALGVVRVIAVNSVGGISADFAPRVICLPDQIIDYTHGRPSSLWDAPGAPLHVDFAKPYSAGLRLAVQGAAKRAGVALRDGGCYGVTQGPRLETCAEIERMRRDGCDLVGMTGMPEAALARELGLDYACLAIVANWAAGRGPGAGPVTMDEVLANMAAATASLPELLRSLPVD